MFKRLAISLTIVAISTLAAGGQVLRPLEPPRLGDARAATPIGSRIDALIAPDSANWSVLIRSLDGAPVYERNPDMPLQPASNMKVLTTAAALDALGPGWTTRTSVYSTAEPSDGGTVEGDLVLYGRGDPNLSGRFSETGDVLEPLRQLAGAVRSRGIVRVTGDLIADDSYLTGAPHGAGWAWQDLQWHFGTEVSALSFNDNLATIRVFPGTSSGPCVVEITPDIGHVEILNTTITGREARISVHRGVDGSVVEVAGSLPEGHPGVTVEVAVHNPPGYAAAAFRRALADAGVVVEGTIRCLSAYEERPEELELYGLYDLASLPSRPLADLVRVTNKQSQNLHAELILGILGREFGPADMPTDQAGSVVVRAFLAKIDADVAGSVLQDGSGLSRLNRIPASVLDAVMRTMASHESRAAFVDSLPIAGIDGTLRRRLGALTFSAKTGSLATAKSISGYVTANSGRRFVVSMIYNDSSGSTRRALPTMDRVIEAVAGE